MTALFLQGLSLEWAARPHRVHAIGAACDAFAAGSPPPRGAVSAHVEGGTWASGRRARDTATVDLACGGIRRAAGPVLRTQARVVLTGAYPEAASGRHAGTADIPLTVTLPAGEAWTDAAAWLTAFDLRTDLAHPAGFTIHALEVHLDPPVIAGGEVRVVAHVLVEAASVPDRVQSLTTYGAEVALGVAVVPTAAERVRRVPASTVDHHGIGFGEHTPTPERVGVVVQLPAGEAGAVAGLSGFRMAVEERGYTEGRYLRELAARVEDVRYDPWTGRASADVALAFSNAGTFARTFDADVSADVTFLALGAGESAWGARWREDLVGPTWTVPYP